MEATAALIAQLGFPIFCALWHMVRTDKLLQEMTRSINALSEILRKH